MDKWFLVLVVSSAAGAVKLNDETYYSMPNLFDLDDYDRCLTKKGTFCLGTFRLTSFENEDLYDILQAYSEQNNHFNHTLVHRGYCITTSCPNSPSHWPPHKRFQDCVNQKIRSEYGLEAKLLQLDYCKATKPSITDSIDLADLGFLVICGLLIFANVIGTFYDIFRNKDEKGNQLLLSWSIINNIRRFTTTYPNDDSQLSRFNALHGFKSLLMMLVLLTHSIIIYHSSYLYNPEFLEKARQHPLSNGLQNGSSSVQAFIFISGFIFTYNYLQHLDWFQKMPSLKVAIFLLTRRLIRITPVYMLVVGFMSTWSRFMGDGPLWNPIMEKTSEVCKRKFWSHAFYVHNLYRPNDTCLLQGWFVAVDVQMYAFVICLVLALTRFTNARIKILSISAIASILCNFALTYTMNFKAMVYLNNPETVRKFYHDEDSFNWWYAAPWGSLTASILGVLFAFLYDKLVRNKIDVSDYLLFRILYRISIAGLFLMSLCGYFLPNEPGHIFSATYAAIERPTYCLMFSVMFLGCIYRTDRVWWRILAWEGWQFQSRMSLCLLMVHWTFNLLQIGLQTNLNKASVFEIAGHWLVTIFMTYVTSIPLHLLVEAPVQKFLQHALGL